MCLPSSRASRGEAEEMFLAATANGKNTRRLIELARQEVKNVVSALPADVRHKPRR